MSTGTIRVRLFREPFEIERDRLTNSFVATRPADPCGMRPASRASTLSRSRRASHLRLFVFGHIRNAPRPAWLLITPPELLNTPTYDRAMTALRVRLCTLRARMRHYRLRLDDLPPCFQSV
jgi:hypothetical protein